jgi:hypothetical protein
MMAALAFGLGLGMTAQVQAQLAPFTWANVGNPNNPTSSGTNTTGWGGSLLGIGSVGYTFQMSAYETTNQQYAYFLNTVDSTGANANALYSSSMSSDPNGGITFNSLAAPGAKYSANSGLVDLLSACPSPFEIPPRERDS